MKLESKFDFDDQVWHISQRKRKEWSVCAFCEGVGKVQGKDGTWKTCLECYGRKGYNTYHEDQWELSHDGPLTVGQIRVEVRNEYRKGEDSGPSGIQCDNYGHQESRRREEYMMRETGIGTGSIFYSEDLFASREDAQVECNMRNATKEDFETTE